MADPVDGGPPTLAMVAAGGIGVLVVVAFVAGVAFSGRTRPPEPGERVAVARAGPGAEDALAVLAPRCRDERVKAVEVRLAGQTSPAAAPLWRIDSRKGSIDERYLVGAEEVPVGFEVDQPLVGPLPDGELVASVVIDGDAGEIEDSTPFSVAAVAADGVSYLGRQVGAGSFQARALAVAACPESRSDTGAASIIFSFGAAAVVGAYLVMVGRWWRGRRAP